MKKTLVALAAVSVTAGAFAQASITGTLAHGYKATKATGTSSLAVPNAILTGLPIPGATTFVGSSGGNSAGWGVDTSQINVSVKEEIGGGQTIEAAMAFAGADRSGESSAAAGNGAVTGRDATLTYTNTSFGRIQMGSTEGAAVHSGIPSADAPVIDMDGKLFQRKSNSDFISYAAPIGPLLFQYKLSESSEGMGLGSGSEGAQGKPVGQRTSDFVLAFNQGPMTVVGVYRSYDNRDSDTIVSPLGLTKDNVYGVQLGYDAGFAKFGFGYNSIKASVGPKVQDVLVGVSAPVGSWTLGATYGMAVTSGVSDTPATAFPGGAAAGYFKSVMQLADGTATGYSLGAKYNFSKRTNVLIRHASWVRSGYEQFEAWGDQAKLGAAAAVLGLNQFGYTDRATETSVILAHNF